MSRLTLPMIFQDGVVLQRRKPVCVWGCAEDGRTLTVSLGCHSASATAKNGMFRTFLPPMQAGTGLTMTVSDGEETITIRDVAIGEVWIAGGQSNMEFLLKHDAEKSTACAACNPNVRTFEVKKISFEGQEQYYTMSDAGIWRKQTPTDSPLFTAVGFYFANSLFEAMHVPVGIINCTWGGTSAVCWVDESYLTGELQVFLDKYKAVNETLDYEEIKQTYIGFQQRMLKADIDMGKPNLSPISPLIDDATHERLMTMNNWPVSAFRPCALYHFMVETIVPYTVSGVIWYQGESDEYWSELYEAEMKTVIRCWRDAWGETIPFIMVQLASFEVMAEYLDFVSIRRTQEKLARTVEQTYLVTAVDAGMRYDIHPKFKRPIGERLARQALDKVYGCHLLADSPTIDGADRQGDTVTIRLKHTGDALVLRDEAAPTIDISVDGTPVEKYSLQLCKNAIQITSPEFSNGGTISIRYCQRPWNDSFIYNAADLPVLPFEVKV